MNFAERLKFLRTRRNITQQELATDLGISRTSVAGYESLGKQPTFDGLISIAKYFDVTTDYLLGVSDNEFENDSMKYFIDKVDKIFDESREELKIKGEEKYSHYSNFPKRFYELVIQSMQYYSLDYAITDAFYNIINEFLKILEVIDDSNTLFRADKFQKLGDDLLKIRADHFMAETIHQSNEIKYYADVFIEYCGQQIEEGYFQKKKNPQKKS